MKEKIYESIALLYYFARDPFGVELDQWEDDKSMVIVASIITAFVAIVNSLVSLSDEGMYRHLESVVVYLLVALVLAPLLGLLIVHLKGGIFYLAMRFVVAPYLKIDAKKDIHAKQVETFASMGLIVSAVPSLTYVGVVVSMIIRVIGLHRLYGIELKHSIIIGVGYSIAWWAVIQLITASTLWL